MNEPNEPFDPKQFHLLAEPDLTDDVPPESCRDQLRREHEAKIEALQLQIDALKLQLKSYEQGTTLVPPPSSQDAPTGDFTRDAHVAMLEQRVDMLESLASARAGELQDLRVEVESLHSEVKQLRVVIADLKDLLEKYPAVDPQNIRDILGLLQRIPCLKGCEPDPDTRSTLHSIRCAGE